MSDERIADLVRSDQIDILVDVAGHTSGHLLRVFARKPRAGPAHVSDIPIRLEWQMDYRLTDAVADPQGAADAWHTEQLVRLPASPWCYRPPDDGRPSHRPPLWPMATSPSGRSTIVQKLNDRVLDLWAQVLCAAPGTALF